MYFQKSAVFPTFGSPTIIILYLRTLSYVKYLSSIIAIYYNYEVVILLHHIYSNQSIRTFSLYSKVFSFGFYLDYTLHKSVIFHQQACPELPVWIKSVIPWGGWEVDDILSKARLESKVKVRVIRKLIFLKKLNMFDTNIEKNFVNILRKFAYFFESITQIKIECHQLL